MPALFLAIAYHNSPLLELENEQYRRCALSLNYRSIILGKDRYPVPWQGEAES